MYLGGVFVAGVLSVLHKSSDRWGRLIRACGLMLLVSVAAQALCLEPASAAGRDDPTAERVSYANAYGHGAIIIRTSERTLYYTLSDREAIRYQIAVGSPENQWFGTTYVSAKRENPGWTPTRDIRRKNPRLPKYVPPGPKNPLGERALYLDWGTYRIHGTNAPRSIGRAVSNGCFRMRNADVIDLFKRVHIGAPVYVEN